MTFAPDFLFYRDGRAIGGTPSDDSFWEEMKAEALHTFTQRQTTYPGLVLKGRMNRTDADRELRVSRAIAEDWRAMPRTDETPIASWAEMVHCLRRDIALRRKIYPQRVEAGQLDATDADRRLLLVETWHDLLWHSHHPDAIAARAATNTPERRAA